MNKEQALKFTEQKLLPTILSYWTEKTLKGMTMEAKEALQTLWKEHMRPGTTYMISCPDCPAMGLDTIGSWYCKAFGFPPSVAVIQAGIDGTIEQLVAERDAPKSDNPILEVPPTIEDVFSKLPAPEVKDGQPTKTKK